MATITLEYDGKNSLAIKTLDFILSLGVFTKKNRNNELDQSLEEVKKGKINTYSSVDDFFNKLT